MNAVGEIDKTREGTGLVTAAQNNGAKSFLYVSELLGGAVINAEGRRIGRLADLKVRLGEIFPKVVASLSSA